ncbi:MAG: hypothetical protein ACXVJN_23470 [Mucilaginibacter sp.]
MLSRFSMVIILVLLLANTNAQPKVFILNYRFLTNVDPPFLFMLTHHSCMLTHPENIFTGCGDSCMLTHLWK